MVALVSGLEGLGGEVVGEEECVYPLGSPVPRKEFFIKIDVAFGIYAWVGLVRFKFDGAVDVVILEGFVEVPPPRSLGHQLWGPSCQSTCAEGHQGQRTSTWRGG